MRAKQVFETAANWRRVLTAFLLLAALHAGEAALGAGQAKVKPKDLAPTYQEWLKFVDYIIADKERDVFLHLTSDQERDLFIKAFWRVRDPTPGTPENEYLTEHTKRFQEANRRYRFGSAREGWMTDRGRMYIILGPPISTESIAGSNDVYPAEIWSYYGDTTKGLPTHFQLVFFQYRNSGEFKLYDPVSDGPARLMVKGMTDYAPSDYERMYKDLFRLQPDLALVAFSIIPGEIESGWQPSLQSTVYLAAILDSPKKGLDESYATHFLNFKGVVSTEYLTNYMKSDGQAAVMVDPFTGVTFCDFAVAPERLSLDYYEPKSQYFCAFQLDVSLRSGDKTIFQYGKEYPITIPQNDLKNTEGMGLAIADSFPIIDGTYHLTVLLRNTAGREFTVFERDVEVPAVDGPPRIVGPAIGVKMVDVPAGARLPFQVERRKLNPDPKNPFSGSDQIVYAFSVVGLTEDLLKGGRVDVAVQGTSASAAPPRARTIPLAGGALRRSLTFSESLEAADLQPDYYDLTLTLKDSRGQALDEQKAHFIVSPAKTVSHPIVAAKAFPLANGFLFRYMQARQYDQMGRTAEAEAAYRSAFAANPGYLAQVPDYAAFLLKVGKAADVLGVVESIRDEANLKFQYFLLKGRALLELKRYEEAVQNLSLGNRIYDSDAVLLAALGTGYYRLGQKENALAALRGSLKVKPDQPDIEKLIQEIEGKK